MLLLASLNAEKPTEQSTHVAAICSKRRARSAVVLVVVVGAAKYPLHLNLINETGGHSTGIPASGTARGRPDMLAAV